MYDAAEAGDEVNLDLAAGTIETKKGTLTCTKLPPYMQGILDAGGLIASLNKEDN